jgi:hypothetical protein
MPPSRDNDLRRRVESNRPTGLAGALLGSLAVRVTASPGHGAGVLASAPIPRSCGITVA